jgi:hypothetical protein
MFLSAKPKRPESFGAAIAVRQAAADDLPPGCVWISGQSIDEAAKGIQKEIVSGTASSAIWVPPQTENILSARRFFAQTAGNIGSGWAYNSTLSMSERMQSDVSQKVLEDFRRAAGRNGARPAPGIFGRKNFSPSDYNAAKAELDEWAGALLNRMDVEQLRLSIESDSAYEAHVKSYYIHDDGFARQENSPRSFRMLIPFHGDNAFLYDINELDSLLIKSREEGFTIFKPRGDIVNAWSPPEHAVVVLTDSLWGRAQSCPHSAKGSDFATHPHARVLAKVDVFLKKTI